MLSMWGSHSGPKAAPKDAWRILCTHATELHQCTCVRDAHVGERDGDVVAHGRQRRAPQLGRKVGHARLGQALVTQAQLPQRRPRMRLGAQTSSLVLSVLLLQ
jgi:hypothetical protein